MPAQRTRFKVGELLDLELEEAEGSTISFVDAFLVGYEVDHRQMTLRLRFSHFVASETAGEPPPRYRRARQASQPAGEKPPEYYEAVGRRAREERERAAREEERRRASAGPEIDPEVFEAFFNAVFGAKSPFGARRPGPGAPRPRANASWSVLLGSPATLADAERAYKRMAREKHPDHGGSHEEMVQLNAAIETARRCLR